MSKQTKLDEMHATLEEAVVDHMLDGISSLVSEDLWKRVANDDALGDEVMEGLHVAMSAGLREIARRVQMVEAKHADKRCYAPNGEMIVDKHGHRLMSFE